MEQRIYSREWTFEEPTSEELRECAYGPRLDGRWFFLDADCSDPEALDDAPRPSDRVQLAARRAR